MLLTKKTIFSLFKNVDNIDEYKYFDNIISYYSLKPTLFNRFNFVGADRMKNNIFYLTNDLLATFYECQCNLYKKATMIMGTFENKLNDSKEDSCGIYENDNIVGCVNGEILNKNDVSVLYNTQYSNNNSFIVNAYKYVKFYLRNTIDNMSLILNELNGNFSIILIDMNISKAFIYRRNFPLYCRRSENNFIIMNEKLERPQISFENDLIYIPNKTCYILDLKTMQFTNYKKIDNFDTSLNKQLTMKVFTKDDLLLLNKNNDSDYYYSISNNVNDFNLDNVYKRISNKMIIEEFTNDFTNNTDLQNYEFVIRCLNFAIKNNIGRIKLLNTNERNCELLRIFKNVIENFSYDIELVECFQ